MIKRTRPTFKSKAATVPAVIKALGRNPVIAAAMFMKILNKAANIGSSESDSMISENIY